ncbi:reverse transcriptase domain-containing protein [Tanacetum coccineum]
MHFPFSLRRGTRYWLEKEPPRSIQTGMTSFANFIINQFFPPSKTTNLRNEITNFKQRFDESFSEAWDRFKDLLRACPHHGFSELHQLDTFYNALNVNDQDSLNSAAGGNFLDKRPADCSSIIESKSKVRHSRSKAIVAKVSTNASTSGVSPDVAELKDMVRALLLDKQTSPVPAPAPVKAAYKFFTKELISSRSAFRSSIKASAYDQRLKCCSWSLCFNPSGFPQKAKYALEILKKHKYDNCHSIGTPLATKPKLDVDLSGEPVDQNDYRSKIGSLMYLTSSRPDLVQAVCYCARYQARTTQKHLKEVKRIFKYLKSVTLTCGLWYPKDYGCENYTAFSDADNAGALILEKHFLEGTTVPW